MTRLLPCPGHELLWPNIMRTYRCNLFDADGTRHVDLEPFAGMLAVYLRDCDAEERSSRIRDTYRQRCDPMVTSLEVEMPREVDFTRPDGSFFLNGGHDNTIRLHCSNVPPGRIVQGVERLAGVIRQALSNWDSRPLGSGLPRAHPSPAPGSQPRPFPSERVNGR